jgi:type III secretion protein L
MSLKNKISPDDLPTEPGSRILRAADVEAWREGYRFLALARETAARAEESARSAYDAAYKKGFAEGQAAGAIEANRIVREAALAVDRYLGGLDKEISSLALKIVRRVIGALDVADLVARAATQALTEFRQEKNIRIAVHPAAADRVSSALGAFGQDDRSAVTVTVQPDPALGKDACILVSDDAVVDATIEVQIGAIEAGLISSSGERNGTP